jgi:hypothetical protein
MLMGGFTAAALPSTSPALIDLAGMWVVPPGGFIAIGALTASDRTVLDDVGRSPDPVVMATAAQHVVLVSRQWHSPAISVGISGEGIAIALALPDFLAALVTELGSPATILTRAQLAARLETAAARVVQGMKAETARVI